MSPDTKSELTTDGIYLNGYGHMFQTKIVDNPWILYDLGKLTTINEIIIKTVAFSFICDKIKISVGDFLINDGNFSPYNLLNPNADPCDNDDEIMHF